MAHNPQRKTGVAMLLVVSLALVAPGLLVERHALTHPVAADVPPALDRFLASVRAATPAHARILVTGSPPALAFYRATYMLYPRTIYSAVATDYAHSTGVPQLDSATVQRLARRERARYVLLWGLRLALPGTIRLNSGSGTLVEAPR